MISNNIFVERTLQKNISNAINYHTLPRFRWYTYKEGFSPSLVEEAIKNVGINKEDYILDPFNGNGTVTLTASINNLSSIGIEVNPFVAFMSRTKLENISPDEFSKDIKQVLDKVTKGHSSNLQSYSTFSDDLRNNKWLFNSEVLKSFEGGWQSLRGYSDSKKNILQLSLIGAAMDNCNAVKDGKCLKYRNN